MENTLQEAQCAAVPSRQAARDGTHRHEASAREYSILGPGVQARLEAQQLRVVAGRPTDEPAGKQRRVHPRRSRVEDSNEILRVAHVLARLGLGVLCCERAGGDGGFKAGAGHLQQAVPVGESESERESERVCVCVRG